MQTHNAHCHLHNKAVRGQGYKLVEWVSMTKAVISCGSQVRLHTDLWSGNTMAMGKPPDTQPESTCCRNKDSLGDISPTVPGSLRKNKLVQTAVNEEIFMEEVRSGMVLQRGRSLRQSRNCPGSRNNVGQSSW